VCGDVEEGIELSVVKSLFRKLSDKCGHRHDSASQTLW
jgi:hypothetical protein